MKSMNCPIAAEPPLAQRCEAAEVGDHHLKEATAMEIEGLREKVHRMRDKHA